MATPHPVRTIVTAEGKYLHMADVVRNLKNEKWMDDRITPLLKVGHDRGLSPAQILKVVVAAVLCESANEMELAKHMYAKRLKEGEVNE